MTTTAALTVSLLLAVASLTVLAPKESAANGAVRIIVNDAPAGPYLVTIGILPGSPTVGLLHVSIRVLDAAAETPVDDATVTVTATGPAPSTGPAPIQAANTPQSPHLYEGFVTLDAIGRWSLGVEIESPLGRGTLETPIQVTEGGRLNLFYIALGTAVVGIAGLLAWTRWQRRGRSRRTGTP